MQTTTIDLRDEAIAEARRLTAARAFDRTEKTRRPDAPLTGPLIARARGRRRRGLAGRILCIWRIGCEDGAGRATSTAIVAALVHVASRPAGCRWRQWCRAIVVAIESRAVAELEPVLRRQLRNLLQLSRAQADARLAREQAVAVAFRSGHARSRAYQAGLFDRRSERAHRAHLSQSRDDGDLVDARLRAAATAAAIVESRPSLRLVLMP
jgi:hypothetical protein